MKTLKLGLIIAQVSFYTSQKIRTLIQSVDSRIVFLFPYSSDLNPTEKFWGNMKR
ncbi:transposase [Holospora curviuscula]|uniref:transposase n=1 Tax=Holospora curviuscula TaxID=1082868 RepID=UPI000CE59B88